MYVRTGQRARVTYPGRRTLGDAANSSNSWLVAAENVPWFDWATWGIPLVATGPGGSPLDIAYNAASGSLTPSQVAAVKAGAAAQITAAAGGNAALAQDQITQANQNIDSVIAMNDPVTSALTSTVSATGIPLWGWIAGGALALWLLTR